MQPIVFVSGNKNYSSWSMRAGLALRATGAPFEEIVIPLDQPDSAQRKRERSPSGRVPALQHGDVVVWESLAICEYLAEVFPRSRLWPEDRAARAVARSVSNEMHAGFAALRAGLPVNVRGSDPGRERSAEVETDIRRIQEIWDDCRARFGQGGPYLFGGFTIADCMYAPVATRFRTYAVDLPPAAASYAEAVLDHPVVRDWIEGARAEPWSIEKYDRG